jgi:hypothetical protein
MPIPRETVKLETGNGAASPRGVRASVARTCAGDVGLMTSSDCAASEEERKSATRLALEAKAGIDHSPETWDERGTRKRQTAAVIKANGECPCRASSIRGRDSPVCCLS